MTFNMWTLRYYFISLSLLSLCALSLRINASNSGLDRISSSTIVINTWNFTDANSKAWDVLLAGGSAIDAIEIGCGQCEIDQCDGTVGWGGSPSESGETTLDAMIMDGENYNVGAVGAMRRIKSAIAVARKVLENTDHTLLVGEMATKFAVELGFKEQTLTSDKSRRLWLDWMANSCQPNYWRKVIPDPRKSCGPYTLKVNSTMRRRLRYRKQCNLREFPKGHDTIGMMSIDTRGRIAAGTSTNGLRFKILGRVGDSPIPGAGAYAAHEAGAAVATGDGDVMMRFLISYQAVENLRQGIPTQLAVDDAIRRVAERVKWPFPQAAAIVMDRFGNYAAACIGWEKFPFVVSSAKQATSTMVVDCFQNLSQFKTKSDYKIRAKRRLTQ